MRQTFRRFVALAGNSVWILTHSTLMYCDCDYSTKGTHSTEYTENNGEYGRRVTNKTNRKNAKQNDATAPQLFIQWLTTGRVISVVSGLKRKLAHVVCSITLAHTQNPFRRTHKHVHPYTYTTWTLLCSCRLIFEVCARHEATLFTHKHWCHT